MFLLKAKNNLLAVRRKSVGDEGKALSEGEDAPEDSLPIGVLEPRKRGNFPESGKPLSSSLLVQKPIIEGILYVENSSGKWKKRWAVLDSQSLYIFKNAEDKGVPEQISLQLCSIKHLNRKKTFQLVTRTKIWKFEAKSTNEMTSWARKIQEICDSLTIQTIEHSEIEAIPKEEIYKLRRLDGNSICADCGSPEPEWASINIGIFICIECSGIHRNLGVHISKVRSIEFDSWEQSMIEFMKTTGNIAANAIWEANLPVEFIKPDHKSPIGRKSEWIIDKYELGLFKPKDQKK